MMVETEGDESKEEETEEKEEEELRNQSRSRSQNLSEGSIGDFFFVGGSPNNTNMNIWIVAKMRPATLGLHIMTSLEMSRPYTLHDAALHQVNKLGYRGRAAVDLSFSTVPRVASGEPISTVASTQPSMPIDVVSNTVANFNDNPIKANEAR